MRLVLLLILLLPACGLRGGGVPPVSGSLGDVIVQASFADEPAPELGGELLLDSIAFRRLGELAGAPIGPVSGATLVDPTGVLVCPEREPCRVRGDAIFLTVWDAMVHDDGTLDVTVSRTQNARRLYVLTVSVTHQIRLRREAAGWRLVERERVPG